MIHQDNKLVGFNILCKAVLHFLPGKEMNLANIAQRYLHDFSLSYLSYYLVIICERFEQERVVLREKSTANSLFSRRVSVPATRDLLLSNH